MEWTITYIVSQILTIIKYSLLGATYYSKNRKKVLIFNFTSVIVTMVIFILLKAWSGLATAGITFFANIIFLIEEKNNSKEKNSKNDVIILITIYTMFIICSVITYEGLPSLFSILAGMVFIYSIWQKKTSIYKLLGIATSLLWMSYNIYIMSILGIIFESIIFICSITGYILERTNKRKK